MRHPGLKLFMVGLLFLLFEKSGRTQECPPNLDFETATFQHWDCKYGMVGSTTGQNLIEWLGNGPIQYRHTIIDALKGEVDEYGNFPQACPEGGRFSIKIGNKEVNSGADGVFYTFYIPEDATNYSIRFYYAMVLQNPLHQAAEQPRFRARVYDVTDDITLDCADFDYVASGDLPGFQHSTKDVTVLYKDWTPVTLSLGAFAGKTLRLEFIATDCTLGGHFGYAYVDVSSICDSPVFGSGICPNAHSVTLTAPFGFQSYAWYADNTFTNLLSSSQTLTLSPVPSAGTTFPVVVVPYPGYGCPDTIYTPLKLVDNPIADAGPDKTICSDGQAIIGGTSSPGTYKWTPASALVVASGMNAITIANLPAPTEFALEVTSSYGCKGYDTVLVTPITVDTSMRVYGDLRYCEGSESNVQLELMHPDPGVSIQWYLNGMAIAGATGSVYAPNAAGNAVYLAGLTKGDCIRSTREVNVVVIQRPRTDFKISQVVECINTPVNFYNLTISPPGDTYSFEWWVSDGTVFSGKDFSRPFSNAGTYDVMLKAISVDGCRDSISKTLDIKEDCGVHVPSAFTPGHDGLNDLLKPLFSGAVQLHYFAVYDRNGNCVFTTSRAGEGWDGTYKGRKLTTSVFVWVLDYGTPQTKHILLKGTVALIR